MVLRSCRKQTPVIAWRQLYKRLVNRELCQRPTETHLTETAAFDHYEKTMQNLFTGISHALFCLSYFSRKNFVRILPDKQDINSSIVFVYHSNIQAWLAEIQVMF